MKIFVAGPTGALGRRLVPRLVSSGHTVVGTTCTASKAEQLRAVGATPVVLDALDRDAVIGALIRAEPEVVVHQLTALTGFTDFRKLDESFAATKRELGRGPAYPSWRTGFRVGLGSSGATRAA